MPRMPSFRPCHSHITYANHWEHVRHLQMELMQEKRRWPFNRVPAFDMHLMLYLDSKCWEGLGLCSPTFLFLCRFAVNQEHLHNLQAKNRASSSLDLIISPRVMWMSYSARAVPEEGSISSCGTNGCLKAEISDGTSSAMTLSDHR